MDGIVGIHIERSVRHIVRWAAAKIDPLVNFQDHLYVLPGRKMVVKSALHPFLTQCFPILVIKHGGPAKRVPKRVDFDQRFSYFFLPVGSEFSHQLFYSPEKL